MSERYRGYTIERNPKPGPPGTCPDCGGKGWVHARDPADPRESTRDGCATCKGSGRAFLHDYDYVHDAYDGPGDSRRGTAHSVSAARAEIDDLIDEGAC